VFYFNDGCIATGVFGVSSSLSVHFLLLLSSNDGGGGIHGAWSIGCII
jgi:hypothetical protein